MKAHPFGSLQIAQLQLFLRVADAGSLSAAARQLHLTPAAASAALKRLEQVLAVRLVERSTRSLRLTPQGEVLREHAARALGALDDARSLLGAEREHVEGEVHVAAPSDLGREVLAPLLDGLLARHPGLQLVMLVSDGMHDLLRERVDIAVRYGELRDSSLVARRLHSTERVLVAAPQYLARHGTPLHPRDLARHNCLALYLDGRPELQWTLRDGDAAAALPVAITGNRRADDGALVRRWAVQGLGIANKARLDVLADLRTGRLVRVLPQWHCGRLPLHAIVPAKRHLPLRVRCVVDELVLRFAGIEAGETTPDSAAADAVARDSGAG